MTVCPTPEKLASYLLDELDEGENRTITEHVDECTACEDRMANLVEELAFGEDRSAESVAQNEQGSRHGDSARGANGSSAPKDPTATNLLFGILALHNSFITRAQLIAATSEWLEDKSQSLQDILFQQDALTLDDQKLLQSLTRKHLENHNNDVEQSLADLSSSEIVKEDLKQLNDPDVDASMQIVPTMDASSESSKVAEAVRKSYSERDRFEELSSHAKGGLGEVFVAVDKQLDRNVALKRIQPRLADDQFARLRFEQEAEVTGKLEHPGVVPVYALGADESGRPFYAMRFIKGRTLKDDIEDFHKAYAGVSWRVGKARVEFHALINRLVDVCNTIEYAHHRGILHRDLKPDNIMLGKFGETIVVDWGLAKKAGSSLPEEQLQDADEEPIIEAPPGSEATPTTFGTVVGTLGFMSPEQATGYNEDIGPPSDIYGLGAVLYRMITNKSSQSIRDGKMEALRKIENGEFNLPRSIQRNIPEPIESICLKAMALRPEDRYATCRDMANDLESWIAEERVAAHQESFLEQVFRLGRRYRGWVATAIGVLAALLIIAVLQSINAELRHKQDLANESAMQNLVRARRTVDTWLSDSAQDMRGIPGVQLFRKHLLDQAVGEYGEMLEASGHSPEYEFERARTLIRLGDMQFELAELTSCQKNYELASSVLSTLSASEFKREAKFEMGNCKLRLARLAIAVGNADDPQNAPGPLLGEAKRTFEELASDSPDNAEYRSALGATLIQRGSMQLNRGDFVDAEQSLQQSVKAFEKAISLSPTGERTNAIRGLASARSLLGEVFRRRGDAAGNAQKYFQQALDYANTLLQESPNDPELKELRADAQGFLVQVYRAAGKVADEQTTIGEMQAAYASLVRDFPDTARYRESVARVTSDEGQLLHALGDTESALAKLNAAEKQLTSLAQANPIPRNLEQVAICLDSRANCFLSLKDFEQALRDNQLSIANLRQVILSLGGTSNFNQHRLATCLCRTGQIHAAIIEELPAANRSQSESFVEANNAYLDAAELLRQIIEQLSSQPDSQEDATIYDALLAQVYDLHGTLLWSTGDETLKNDGRMLLTEAKNIWQRIGDKANEYRYAQARFHISIPIKELRDSNITLDRAKAAGAATPQNPDYQATLGAAHYRIGEFEMAETELRKAAELRGKPRSFDLIFLAMAQAEQKRTTDAQETLGKAKQEFEKREPGNVRLRRLYKEAEELTSSLE